MGIIQVHQTQKAQQERIATYNNLIGNYKLKENPQSWSDSVTKIRFNNDKIILDNKVYSIDKHDIITSRQVFNELYATTKEADILYGTLDEIDYTKQLYIKLTNTLFLNVQNISQNEIAVTILQGIYLPKSKKVDSVSEHFVIMTKTS